MKSILVVGTARNLESKIVEEVCRVNKLLNVEFKLEFFIVESDSQDGTLQKLNYLRSLFDYFEYESLGKLQDQFPNRIERLRFCRNRYVNFIRLHTLNRWDYVLVMDLDGINRKITRKGLFSCFKLLEDWDACFPVQKHGYHDLLALRAENWNSSNPFHVVRDLIKSEKEKSSKSILSKIFLLPFKVERIRKKYFYSKMLKIDSRTEPIPVLSAFGGVGIYKAKVFFESDYGTSNSIEECEHVDFNLKASKLGYKFVINTSFVNSNWNSYNLNRLLIIRLYRKTGLTLRKD